MKNIIPSLSYDCCDNRNSPVNTVHAETSNRDTKNLHKVLSFEQKPKKSNMAKLFGSFFGHKIFKIATQVYTMLYRRDTWWSRKRSATFLNQ